MSQKPTIVFGSDHGGYELKQILHAYCKKTEKFNTIDAGTYNNERCDYPDVALKACKHLSDAKHPAGL